MGIGVAGRILIEAAAGEWPEVEVFHRKGLAQRGGGVFSHVMMHDGAVPRSAEIAGGRGRPDPRPRADRGRARPAPRLARAHGRGDGHAPPADDGRPHGRRRSPRRPAGARQRRDPAGRPGGHRLLGRGPAECSGDRIYANVAVLGAAWQRGWIPLPLTDHRGRGARGHRRAAPRPTCARSCSAACWPRPTRESRAGRGRRGPDRAARRDGSAPAASGGPSARPSSRRARARTSGRSRCGMLAPRLPEIVAWGGAAYAEPTWTRSSRVRAAAPALMPAAIHNLHRAMAIKDEVFVAHQLTSPRKYARDRERFGIDRSRGRPHLTTSTSTGPPSTSSAATSSGTCRRATGSCGCSAARASCGRCCRRGTGARRAFRDWYEHEVVGAVVRRPARGAGRRGGAAAARVRDRLPRRAVPEGGRRLRALRGSSWRSRGDVIDDAAVGPYERVVHAEDAAHRACGRSSRCTRPPRPGGRRAPGSIPYPSEASAAIDALRLAEGMTLKAAAAGLPAGRGQGRDRRRPGPAALAGALARPTPR